MERRLTGLITTLWFFLALLSLFIALTLSPLGLRLLLPGRHPVTWIYPSLLVLPPIAIGCENAFGAKFSKWMLYAFAVTLALLVVVLFGFLVGTFVGY